jgi:TonB-linked SusC/RagA family outer membrane protein
MYKKYTEKIGIPKGYVHKILLVMRLTTIILIATIMQVSAGTFAQKITLSERNASLTKIFKKIRSQSGYDFVFTSSTLKDALPVNVSVVDAELSDVLKMIFNEQPLNYYIGEKAVIIKVKKTDPASNKLAFIKITGVVRDTTGRTLPNVSILNKNTGRTIATNPDGAFTIDANPGEVLLFSLVGYSKKEITVGSQTKLNIILNEESGQLEQVVVTALGIKKSIKALTYNVQEIKKEELTSVPDANFMNSLAGKVAGVTINTSAAGVGGSTRVVMRGTKSLAGSNGALYVVDGIPLPSLRSSQNNGLYDGGDSGEGISMFNTDDIESISLLTGPASSALYGSDAANGVVAITTKKGTKDKFKLDYSNNTSFSNPLLLPKFQNTYGSNPGTFSSWGPKLDQPSDYNVRDFFQTGYNETNSLVISSGGEKSQTYFSMANVKAEGIIPNNKYSRYNFMIRNTTSLLENKLTLDLNAWYIKQNNQNGIAQGQYFNPLIAAYLFPRGDQIEKYQLYERYNSARGIYTQFWPDSYYDLGFQIQNPYWTINRVLNLSDRERFILSAALNYKVLDWLNITGRVRYDKTANTQEDKRYASTLRLFATESGFYGINNTNDNQIYSDIIANANKSFGDFTLNASLGTSFSETKSTALGVRGGLNFVPNFFHVNNILYENNPLQNQTLDDGHNVTAMFATAQLGYKNWLFVDLTSRYEWNTALKGTSSKSLYYPSAGLSAVVSDILNLPRSGVSFLKLRASYGEVGNSPARYLANPTYTISKSGLPSTISSAPFSTLQPERTKSFETGVNARFLNDKISLDVTLYESNTYNQVFNPALAPSTGFTSTYINGGKVNNKGIEASLGLNFNIGSVKTNSTFVFSKNINKIVEMLAPTTDPVTGEILSVSNLIVSSAGTYRMEIKEGGTMGDIYASGLYRDLNGYIYVHPNSSTLMADNNTYYKVGSSNPDFNLGYRNQISYKNITLGFLIDARVGGVGVSATQAIMDQFGVSTASATARDNDYVMINDHKVPYANYYNLVSGGTTGLLAHYVYSATNVRLREASVSYTLPEKWLPKNIFKSARLSAYGRNLFMFYNKAPFDPESVASTGTYYQGIDYFMQPSYRTIGLSANISF